MEPGAANSFHVIVKQITKFDGRRADEFLECDSKLRASRSVCNKTIFNVLQGQERPSEFDADQKITRAAWDASNQDLYSVLFFTTAGSAFSMVRRFQGKTPAESARRDNRRGQPFARNSTGIRGRPFGRSTFRCQARGCAPGKTPATICTTWIAAGTTSARAIHRKAPRIDNTRTSSSKPFPRSTTVFVKTISRSETLALPTSAI